MGNSSGQTPPLLYYWSILILCSVSNNSSMTLIFANVNKIPPDPSQYFNWLSFFKNSGILTWICWISSHLVPNNTNFLPHWSFCLAIFIRGEESSNLWFMTWTYILQNANCVYKCTSLKIPPNNVIVSELYYIVKWS